MVGALRRPVLPYAAPEPFRQPNHAVKSVEVLLETTEEARQSRLQALGDSFHIHNRNIPQSTLDATVVCAVKPATLRRLFLIDSLLLADTAYCAAKSDADIDGHWLSSSNRAADAYTAYKSR